MPDNIIQEYFASFGVKGLNESLTQIKRFSNQATSSFEKIKAINQQTIASLQTQSIAIKKLRDNIRAQTAVGGQARRQTISEALGMKTMSSAADEATASIKNQTRALGSLRTRMLSTGKSMFTFRRAFELFLGFEAGKKVFDVNQQYLNVVNGLENITNNAKESQDVMDQLQQISLKLHLNFLVLAQDFPKFALSLQGAGLDMGKTLEVFKNISIAIAGAHLLPANAQRALSEFIFNIVNAPKVSSRVFTREVFGKSGFANVLMRGLNAQSVEDLVQKLNKLNEAQRAIVVSSLLAKKFTPGFEKFAKTPQAALNDLATTFQVLLVSLGRSGALFAFLQGFKSLATLLMALKPIFIGLGEVLRGVGFAFDAVNRTVLAFEDLLPKNKDLRTTIEAVTEIGSAMFLLSRSMKVAAAATTLFEIATSPVAATVAGIAASILIIQDAMKFFQGSKHTVTGKVVGLAGRTPFLETGLNTILPGLGFIPGALAAAGSSIAHHVNINVHANNSEGNNIGSHVKKHVAAYYTNKGIIQ